MPPPRPPMSAADRVISSRPHCIHRLRAKDPTGQPAWYFVYVAPEKTLAFDRALAGPDAVELERYGQVLLSGYGEEPQPWELAYLRDRWRLPV